ncbi:hypothetical protein D4Q76_03140 [archaeon]|nr:MAG: hypothetical protein D4Q76_03140 [archaeon]
MVNYIDGAENISPGKVFTGAEARGFYKADNFPDNIVFIDTRTGEAPIGRALSETPYVFAAMDLRGQYEKLSKKIERKTTSLPPSFE